MTSPATKYLTVRQAAFIGVGAMVGAGIFALLGAAGEVAGSAVWVSFLLAGVIAALQGYSFAKLGARFPSAGGLIEYVAKGFGDGHVTGVTAWLTYSANAIVTAMVAVSFGSYASAVFTDEDTTWVKVFAVLIIVVMTVVNIVGSKLVAGAQTVIVYVVVGILVLFAVVTLVNMDPSLLAPSGYPPLQDIVSSVALTFFAFLGFGIITFTAKDLANPARQLPRAMFLALTIATVIYLAIALGVFGTLTVDEVIESGGTALAVAAKPSLGDAGYLLMAITALFATAGATNAGLYPAAGTVRAAGGDGAVPSLHGAAGRWARLHGAAGPGRCVRAARRLLQPGRHRLDRQCGRPADLHVHHGGTLPGPRGDRRERGGPVPGHRVGGGGPGDVRVHHAHPRAGVGHHAAGDPRAQHRPGRGVEADVRRPSEARRTSALNAFRRPPAADPSLAPES